MGNYPASKGYLMGIIVSWKVYGNAVTGLGENVKKYISGVFFGIIN